MYISDFGLSKLIGANPNNPEKNNIFGVLPYIAPEILSGEKEYTKADVHSFGIIAYEKLRAFLHILIYHMIYSYENMQWITTKNSISCSQINYKRCLDARVTHRLTFEELQKELEKYYNDFYEYSDKGKNKDSEIVIQIKKAEEFSANQESANIATTTPESFSHIITNDDIDEF
ncbi:hypothetical protein Glove_421g132 [Diversispora epigaea]|uniref:Protein kinase domain-containing protein n=1 Tax=Diversispora epigaea TaxID=1348612 RepID=A0A397GZS9_9GLOM|nr:hypothetical protein Glove_421g132 [Diversispora epigaea]